MEAIQIKIDTNGEIETKTGGMKDKTCLKYIAEIEKMAEVTATDFEFNNDCQKGNELIISEEQEEMLI